MNTAKQGLGIGKTHEKISKSTRCGKIDIFYDIDKINVCTCNFRTLELGISSLPILVHVYYQRRGFFSNEGRAVLNRQGIDLLVNKVY